MIRQSGRTGRTFSTSSIQREVIQAQGHTGSNQNCTFSRASGCAVTLAGNRRPPPGIPGYPAVRQWLRKRTLTTTVGATVP
jgi:hypothetical protein